MTRDQWIEAFASELGQTPPSADEVDAILKLAAMAAHASERTAAPIAAWLTGASGKSLSEAIDLAERITAAG